VASPQPSSGLVGPSEARIGGMPIGGEGGKLGWLGPKTHLNMCDGMHAQKMWPSAVSCFSCACCTVAWAWHWSCSASWSSRKAAQ
jgi:hypothetical protein